MSSNWAKLIKNYFLEVTNFFVSINLCREKKSLLRFRAMFLCSIHSFIFWITYPHQTHTRVLYTQTNLLGEPWLACRINVFCCVLQNIIQLQIWLIECKLCMCSHFFITIVAENKSTPVKVLWFHLRKKIYHRNKKKLIKIVVCVYWESKCFCVDWEIENRRPFGKWAY